VKHFELDSHLAKDNFILGEFETSLVLLMNNKVAPWFVLVPKVAGVSELYELDKDMQASLMDEINRLSEFVKQQFVVDKLNVAAIGNIVKQLHIHVVARAEDDYCWPGVVWGTDFTEQYLEEEVDELVSKMRSKLTGFSN
jgi:diadenosine tetraphosphate (Ap4A) HIT family hydrolase